MINKLSVSLAALAAIGLAGAASAQNTVGSPQTVNVEIVVQDIAVLEVDNPVATMTIDDNQDSFMGNPSSTGNGFDNLASVKLSTNFPVDAVRFSWDDIDGANPGPQSGQSGSYDSYWAEAFGDGGNNTRAQGSIAVLPQGALLDGPGGNAVGGGGGMVFGPGEIDIDDGGSPFGNGVHYVGIGVSTNWGNTFNSQGIDFAAPDTYVADFEATIVPNL